MSVSVPSPTENFLDHADLYVQVGGIQFTLWSYIDTTKARESVVDKLFNRGRAHDEMVEPVATFRCVEAAKR
mgnify:CR=1 FL=1